MFSLVVLRLSVWRAAVVSEIVPVACIAGGLYAKWKCIRIIVIGA